MVMYRTDPVPEGRLDDAGKIRPGDFVIDAAKKLTDKGGRRFMASACGARAGWGEKHGVS